MVRNTSEFQGCFFMGDIEDGKFGFTVMLYSELH